MGDVDGPNCFGGVLRILSERVDWKKLRETIPVNDGANMESEILRIKMSMLKKVYSLSDEELAIECEKREDFKKFLAK